MSCEACSCCGKDVTNDWSAHLCADCDERLRAERAGVGALMAWIAANRAARTPPFMDYSQAEWMRLWNAMEDAYDALLARRAVRPA